MSWFNRSQTIPDLTTSILYDENSFYNQFERDLMQAEKEVIIESPYLTKSRVNKVKRVFETLIKRKIEVFVITRNPSEHDTSMSIQAELAIQYFERIGVQVLLVKGGHHRKLAIIDRKILWEGSLNILSQYQSREFMRRIASHQLAQELFHFLRFDTLNMFKKTLNLV